MAKIIEFPVQFTQDYRTPRGPAKILSFSRPTIKYVYQDLDKRSVDWVVNR